MCYPPHMSLGLFVLIKMVMVFGLLLGFGLWQIRQLDREGVGKGGWDWVRSARPPGHAEGEHEPDDGQAKAGER